MKDAEINKNLNLKVQALYKTATKSNSDTLYVLKMLKSNVLYDKLYKITIYSEAKAFLQFASKMIWAFPLSLALRYKLRKNKQLNYILQYNELLQVRNNIEKGSFAYDSLLFNLNPIALIKNKSHLANMVCLAILFGDEFIDGIALAHGKENIKTILANPKIDYYLKVTIKNETIALYYAFDICDVLPTKITESINAKYGISYKKFYSHLLFLLAEINAHLQKLPPEKAKSVAALICTACNKCFDTYIDDIYNFEPDYNLKKLFAYQNTKDDDIIQVLLTLRAELLNKNEVQYKLQFINWSSMVRSMQLYDDMQDVATDDDFQMNMLLYFAKNYFIVEYEWLKKNKANILALKSMELHSTIALNMPCSCMLIMQYARNIAHQKLNWVQLKIQNYLWRKNWLGFNNKLLNPHGFSIQTFSSVPTENVLIKLHVIKEMVCAQKHDFINEDMQWAFVLDIALMDNTLRKHIYNKITKAERYFIASCFIEFPINKKAEIAKKLFKK